MSAEDTDPTHATALELSRRAFVGISAATAGLGAVGAPAQTTFGGPHPPIVSETDPAITIENVRPLAPGLPPCYAARPSRPQPGLAAIVVIMHVWGVDESIRDVVRRLAKAGTAAIAPNLYFRLDALSGDDRTDSDAFRPFAKQLVREQVDGDVRSAAQWVDKTFPQSKIGVLGFCMGGRIALQQAIDNSDVFAAVIPFYGAVEGINPVEIRIPVCGSYGARDTSIPAAGVRTFQSELRAPNDIKIYDSAGHGFFDDRRPSYVASAATDAWERTVTFIERYLGAAR
ncbi:MAG: dienelactone hydrolase family protein [Candidatus Eremiobacteraeota bacterium]|nr:dienelactone hydrolase family protein [Candidatus Eremiobacteraeota bacterium]